MIGPIHRAYPLSFLDSPQLAVDGESFLADGELREDVSDGLRDLLRGIKHDEVTAVGKVAHLGSRKDCCDAGALTPRE